MPDDPQRVETLRKIAAYSDTCLSGNWEDWSFHCGELVTERESIVATHIGIEADQEIFAIPLEAGDPDLEERLLVPLCRRLGPLHLGRSRFCWIFLLAT